MYFVYLGLLCFTWQHTLAHRNEFIAQPNTGIPAHHQEHVQQQREQLSNSDPNQVQLNNPDELFYQDRTVRSRDMNKEAEHMKEHHGIDTEKASEEVLEMHYFRINDLNSDDKLDGNEMMKEMLHEVYHEHEKLMEEKNESPKQLTGEKAVEVAAVVVDHILTDDDTDGDGYISLSEYAVSRLKHHGIESTLAST